MSAQKILITCLGLVSLMALGGCNDVKSPTFQPRTEFLQLKVCEADSNDMCPLDGTNCNSRSDNDPSLIAVNLSARFCALGQYSQEQLLEDGDEFSVTLTKTWRNVGDAVAWNSANPQVASIDASGKATGVTQGGPIKISAMLDERVAETSLRVTEPALLDVAISPNGAIELLEGTDLNFACRGSFSAACDSSGSIICDITESADFTSSDNTRFSIDNDGNGSALGATAPDQPVTVICSDVNNAQQPPQTVESDPPAEITVCGVDSITSVEIVPGNLRLPVGSTQQLSLIANYTSCSTGDAQQADVTTSATWTSTDDAIAPVDGDGVVTGLAEGQAEITGSFAGIDSAPLLVIVSDSVVDSLRVEGPGVAFALQGQVVELPYTAYAVLADADTGEIIGEEQLLNAPNQPFATWSSSAAAISFADPNVGLGSLEAGAAAQSVEITASYLGLSAALTTSVVDFSAIKSLEITPSLACVGDALSLGLLGEPVQQLTAHAILEFVDGQGETQSCSAPVTDLAEWNVGGADILSSLLADPQLGDLLGGIPIPGLSDILGVVGDTLDSVLGGVNDALGNCQAQLPLTVGTDPTGSPVEVSNEPPKGQVRGAQDSDNLVGGACVQAELSNGTDSVSAFSSVLAATELQDVCETLLAETEPSVAPCSELQAEGAINDGNGR